jgi:site-specific recombinase XerD
MSALSPILQAFFTDRLIRQRHVSTHTIAAYRDTIRLLLGYAATQTGRPPSRLDLVDLNADMISGFLHHLEHERGNSVRTRNARLAAIHSLFRFALLQHPELAGTISRILAIPPKRFDKALITYLTEPEVDALLAACDQTTWTGRRDHALLLLAVQTGLRISELIGLTRADLHLGAGAHVTCHGKGRKDRITPAHRWHRHRPEELAQRAEQQPRHPAVPDPSRHQTQPRRDRASPHPLRRTSRQGLPVPARQGHHRARVAAYHRNAATSRRRRYQCDRALARTRKR